MPALRQSLVIEQGATFKFVVSIIGGPASLSGHTARMQIRPYAGSPDLFAELTTENGGLTIDTGNRLITIEIDWEDTALFSWMVAEYDLEIEGDDVVYRVMQGSVKLSREVTV